MSAITFRATASRPCPVCGAGSKGCSATGDDLHLCRGEPRGDWRRLTQSPDAAGFHHYRAGPSTAPTHRVPPVQSPPPLARNWRADAERFAKDLTPERRQQLVELLGLPVECLAAFPFLGYYIDPRLGPCFTFTEHAPNGAITAINRRIVNPPPDEPNKKVMHGGRRGLYQSRGWRDGPGPLLLPEGASDVLALVAVGLKAVGRPSNTGGVELLVELLADEKRELIVLGENDRKDDGKWPGREGAEATAQKLADALGREIHWALPWEGSKDSREWVKNLAAETGTPPDYPLVGEEIRARLRDLIQVAAPRTVDLLPADVTPQCGWEIIRDFFRRHYRPGFKSGDAIYSATERREVRRVEACAAIPPGLIAPLQQATDAPRTAAQLPKGADAMPGFFKKWAGTAWAGLLAELPVEDAADLNTAAAELSAEEFRRLVRDVMFTQIVLGDSAGKRDERGPTQQERCSLIDWCYKFAKPGPWKSIRSYRCWCKTEGIGGELKLRVAIRQELFQQLKAHHRLCEMTENTFNRRAERYTVGRSSRADRPEGKSAVVLDQAFIDALLSGVSSEDDTSVFGTPSGGPLPPPDPNQETDKAA